jgi:hypothetical protein
VHDPAVDVDAGALPGQRRADLDDLIAEGDDPGSIDQPRHGYGYRFALDPSGHKITPGICIGCPSRGWYRRSRRVRGQ